MDSISQIVLGAGVGELMMGRKIGNKAILIGAIAGTIPDLDVLLTGGMDDVLGYLKSHRSYSHSMFTHIVIAFPLAWITFKIWKQKYSYWEWYALWFMGLFTHALLDCMTTYGTRLFLPFTDNLVGLNNVSIVDPLYTIPFMAILIWAMFYKKDNPRRRKIALWAMFISTGYLGFTFVAKGIAHQKFTQELKRQNISYQHLSTSPSILNSILWAGIAYDDSMLYVSEYSLLQKKKDCDFFAVPRNTQLIKNHPAREIAHTLEWFSQGKGICVPATNDSLHFAIAKWGRGDWETKDPLQAFLFYYTIYKDRNGKYQLTSTDPSKNGTVDAGKMFNALMNRIFHF
jgi:inner membrane protein